MISPTKRSRAAAPPFAPRSEQRPHPHRIVRPLAQPDVADDAAFLDALGPSWDAMSPAERRSYPRPAETAIDDDVILVAAYLGALVRLARHLEQPVITLTLGQAERIMRHLGGHRAA